jgi:hypothetical protein
MTNYTIEGNIHFQTELYKLLDEDSDDEDNLCQITGLELIDKYLTLECGHKFNYKALYTEICKQRFEFKTYDPNLLTKKDQLKFRESKLDYFIKCPYCRNIQFTILPYYEELGLTKIYGINSLDKQLTTEKFLPLNNSHQPFISDLDKAYTFNIYGASFHFGDCCEKINNFGDICKSMYVSTIPNTKLSYCRYHYKEGFKKYKISEKNKMMNQKMLLKKEKENKLNEMKKQLDEQNIEREAKGLPPLKRLIIKNANTKENIVEQYKNSIKQYVPDEDTSDVCNAILKTGQRKGHICGSKKILSNGLCNRHNAK